VHRIGRTGRAGRAGTAISIVTSLDNKSIAAIERLIGQNIPPAEGDYAVHSDSSGETDQPREHRSREGSRDGSRGGRKPRREREPRAAKSSDSSEREPRPARNSDKRSDKSGEREPRHAKGAGRSAGPQPQAAAAAFVPPAPAQPSRVPSIGRPEPRRAQRDAESEPADHSHLPAFLLRPVRARV
jgi:superfamily II DNA/RNA helicase